MNISSSKIFRLNRDGSVTIIRPIKIGGVTLDNVTFNGDIKIAGIKLRDLCGKELDVDDSNPEVFVIKGYFT